MKKIQRKAIAIEINHNFVLIEILESMVHLFPLLITGAFFLEPVIPKLQFRVKNITLTELIQRSPPTYHSYLKGSTWKD